MITLKLEQLEERIAPDGIGGTPGTGTSNGHGTEVSGGSKPEPEPGR